MMNILNLSADQITQSIKNRDISAVEVIDSYLQQINTVNPQINAIIQLDAEAAKKAAMDIDANLDKYMDKRLLGVPVTVKNFCDVLGFSPDKGCSVLAGNPSKNDATAVARMRAEGAIILGLTNTPEFSIGYETDNLLYGQTKNPYDLAYSPGGSSGGEGAAISSQCSLIGLGSDLSGSLRVPAHYTGITCLKMTQGRIPFTGSIPSDNAGMFSQFISCGPMARYVKDLINVSAILVGPDGIDPHAAPVPWYNPSEVKLKNLNIAYYSDDGVATADEDTMNVVQHCASILSNNGSKVFEDRPHMVTELENLFTHNIFLGGDNGKWLKDIMLQIKLDQPSPLLKEFLSLAEESSFTVNELRQLWTMFDNYRKSLMQFFQCYDAIICPVAATPAKLHGQSFKEANDFSYAISYSMMSCPAAVVRSGTSKGGLPIGIQIISKPWREDIVLKIAEYVESSSGGWKLPKILQSNIEAYN